MAERSEHKQKPISNIYLEDTIQTFLFEKEALQIKFKHNIKELSLKNIYLTNVFKQLIEQQQQKIEQDGLLFKKIVDICISIQDNLASLDTLDKKTQILKHQVLTIKNKYELGYA